MGSGEVGASGIGEAARRAAASERRAWKRVESLPAPMKPMPPARVTATARRAREISRRGAETRIGERVQG